MTCTPSAARATERTSPTSRPRYSTLVSPALMPVASANDTVTAMPCELTARTTSQTTMAIAATGMPQIHPGHQLLWASETLRRGGLLYASLFTFVLVRRVPHQARIEGTRGPHCQHDNEYECDGTRGGLGGEHAVKLQQGDKYRDGEDVDARPAADLIDEAIGARLHRQRPTGTSQHRKHQPAEARKLQQRNRDARAEDEDTQRPQSRIEQLLYAIHDAVRDPLAELRINSHREHVGGEVEYKRGDYQSQGTRDGIGLAAPQPQRAPWASLTLMLQRQDQLAGHAG